MKKQRMVVMVALNASGQEIGYGVLRKDRFKRHYKHRPDYRMDAMFGGDPRCDTFTRFKDAKAHVKECGGKLVDVIVAQRMDEKGSKK